ncbi:asparagine-linked glycosylation protein [Dipsacomyces acuminosporus]|nr:asparagine-linked glycosylation protein [Dipsacomyces acuminosporus]
MVIVIIILTIQTFTLGTEGHQRDCKEKVVEATKPDTSEHEAYYAGFFHPYPNAGGGGERVLWTMIKAIQDKYPFVVCVIYSGDNVPRDELLLNVKGKFGLDIRPETIYVAELTKRWWVDHKFPRFTLLMQSLGSVILASHAMNKFCPDIFIETVGYAFTYPFIRLLTARIPIVSYTHYPAISSDMQTMVSSRESGFNNDEAIANSALLTKLKSLYYSIFAHMYAYAGSFASTIMTNSSWTQDHIVKLFGKAKMTKVVYPPCDTTALAEFPLSGRQPFIVSLAQFRPEKNHKLQIESFAKFLKAHPERAIPAGVKAPSPESLLKDSRQAEISGNPASLSKYPALVMIGGARNIEDEARAEELRQLAKKHGIEKQVHVIVNAPWGEVLDWLKFGKVGLHTMRDEHFGINIVEMMAAGLITIAHDSAGPKLDIIAPAIRCSGDGTPSVPTAEAAQSYLAAASSKESQPDFPVGMVATTAEDFAAMADLALSLDGPVADAIRKAARSAAATKFSETAFLAAFYRRFNPVIRWLDLQRSDDDESFEY